MAAQLHFIPGQSPEVLFIYHELFFFLLLEVTFDLFIAESL